MTTNRSPSANGSNKMKIADIENVCSHRSKIAAYIDGELLPREEIELEAHLAICKFCAAELNEQKKLLCVLDFALTDQDEFKLPENFTKIVVANAESKVSGLRRPKERSNALIVCAVLFLLVLLGLGRETEAVFNTFANFADQFLVVAGFAFHLFYDITLGTAIILRSLGTMLIYNSTVSLTLTLLVFGGSIIALLRLTARSQKFKIQAQEK